MSSTTFILFGFAFIPRLLTIKPKNFLTETPKAHLAGFNFILYSLSGPGMPWLGGLCGARPRTTLANHSGYSTSLIPSAWRSLTTSSLIVFCLSEVKFLHFYLTGLKDGLTFILWVIIARSIPPMSSCF